MYNILNKYLRFFLCVYFPYIFKQGRLKLLLRAALPSSVSYNRSCLVGSKQNKDSNIGSIEAIATNHEFEMPIKVHLVTFTKSAWREKRVALPVRRPKRTDLIKNISHLRICFPLSFHSLANRQRWKEWSNWYWTAKYGTSPTTCPGSYRFKLLTIGIHILSANI